MAKTIRVSDEYHSLLKAHSREDETMEETLRRLTGGPDPRVLASIFDEEDGERIEGAIENLRGRERSRLDRARAAFENETSTRE